LLRKKHKQLNSEGPFVVVDVTRLNWSQDMTPLELRELIYKAASAALSPDNDQEQDVDIETDPCFYLDAFSERSKKIKEAIGDKVGLFIKNMNFITEHMSQEELAAFTLGTFRIGWEFNIYSHVSEKINLSGKAGMNLNDVEIIISAESPQF
jgi:hypothetical protein